MARQLVWRIVRLPKRPFGKWWLQRGWWREQQCWSGTRKRFVIDYEEPHPTREAAQASLDGWVRLGA